MTTTAKKTNTINWFELYASDFDRAVTFYETILEDKLERVEAPESKMGIFPYDAKTGVGGSVTKMEGCGSPGPGGTVVYLNVEGDLDAVVARVPQAGGKVVRPRFAIPPHGFIAIIEDSEGNMVGLHSMV